MGGQGVDLSEEAVSRAHGRIRAIRSPRDVRDCPRKEIDALCDDLRRVLIDRTEKNGGHLASNLGVVELTVAVHRVFDAPTDHIVFDVGHQCYVHKLLTGRAEMFDTLRRPGGLSGFPRRDESGYDAFGTGHASTSLSAAIGFAQADRLCGSAAYTVVVLGDGAFTGGMIHEALNNCAKELNLIIILNENEMSISRNVGSFARLLTRLRTSKSYSCTKSLLERVLEHIPLLGRPLLRGLASIKRGFKRLVYRSNYFESMGLNYFGPIDGNDEQQVERLLRTVKEKGGCSLVHLHTVKGKGYECAEHDPDLYHGVAPCAATASDRPTFSQTMGQTLTALADSRSELCAITAAMRQGTGLTPFFENHPTRFFDVGIAEEHAVTFAAGLAANGMRPVVALYSTFLQRAYDQVLHDVALQRLPVLLAIDRAGLNAADGPTHHGIYDVAMLSHIPGVDIYEPPTTERLAVRLTELVEQGIDHPVALRYPAGRDHERILAYMENECTHALTDGVYADFDETHPPETVVVTYGRLSASVLDAVEKSDKYVGVVIVERLRPWKTTVDALRALCERGTGKLILCEEGIRSGGLAMNLAAELTECLGVAAPPLRVLAIDTRGDRVAEPSADQTSLEAVGLGVADILREINE